MTKEKMQVFACGRNFRNELQNDVIIYSCSVTSCDLIYFEGAEKKFFDLEKLKWRAISSDDEFEVLTLQEISKQLEIFEITHCYLWYKGGLEGTIYGYNNYSNKEWLIHELTKGYA